MTFVIRKNGDFIICGITGMAGNLLPIHRKVMSQLLVLDSLRGEDSTGVAFVNAHTSNVKVVKELGDPFALLYSNKYNKALDQSNKVLIGHNRYATMGGVTRASAHPFEFDTLVGVHNGTLSSKHALMNASDYKVDSENLYHHIEEKGVQDAISKLGFPANAWSLVWWDKLEQTLNFLRNKERPLYMCRSEDAQVLFWASEPWMLEGALGRNGIKHTPIFLTDVDVHHSVHIADKGIMSKPVTKRCAAPVYIAPVHVNHFTPPTTQVTTNPPVVGEVKKTLVVAVDYNYVKSKNLRLEILSSEKDINGATFIVLFDPANPFVSIRCYLRAEDKALEKAIGDEVVCDIGSHVSVSNKGSYYKVNPWTVKRVGNVTYEDANGYPRSESDWRKLYSICAYCNDELDPNRANRFTTGGECLCSSCATDRLITQYVNLK
jgi:predicted glutamine amidotransferase